MPRGGAAICGHPGAEVRLCGGKLHCPSLLRRRRGGPHHPGEREAAADHYYYNGQTRTLWIYTKRIAGQIDALSPGSTAPTAVTVSGNSYDIGSSTASYKLSAVGGGKTGLVVTLLLGMYDTVVDILAGSDVDTTYYGAVESARETVSEETPRSCGRLP